jgi:hypothetical protein
VKPDADHPIHHEAHEDKKADEAASIPDEFFAASPRLTRGQQLRAPLRALRVFVVNGAAAGATAQGVNRPDH